ncbi:MAG TPA: DUF4203 domain-containing protein [Iamia sp.]|nr:DUF4203 domain-containing protein [Iamia sp.]
MEDLVVGLSAVAVGALLCGRGYLALRLLIPLWGAYSGFLLGAGIVAAVTDDPVLHVAVGWPVAIVTALVFGGLAYLYYELSIVISMAGIGVSLGAALMVALGVRWSWLVVLAAVAVGALLAALAIASDLPSVLLVALSAGAGAATIVFGAMLLVGHIDTEELTSGITTRRLHDDWWWYVLFIGLALAGATAQLATRADGGQTLRSRWDAGPAHPR